mmetsp:Transcript_3989/g.5281  ORF Transcript_3989/g.5281 Transcript_3989/m.5281 type:complete len:93 (-) Transcript_3989:357-635(-)
MYSMIGIFGAYFMLNFSFATFCPKYDCIPKAGLSRYWKLEKQITVKKLPSFYDVLSDRQKEAMLIEEIQSRKRANIQHLDDTVLKKLMLSIG